VHVSLGSVADDLDCYRLIARAVVDRCGGNDRMKTDNVYKAARQYELMTAFGTDILLFSSALATQQGALLVSLARW